jgi:hypothetical protein
MAGKLCTKGKSCGATCITRSDRCVLELGPVISKNLDKARKNLGVMRLFKDAEKHGAPGFRRKFNELKGGVERDLAQGRALKAQAHLIELQNRMRKEGLLPKDKSKTKSDDLGAIFARGIEAGKKDAGDLDNARRRYSAAQKGKDPQERWEARKNLAAEEKKAGIAPAPVEGRKISKEPPPVRRNQEVSKDDDEMTALIKKQHKDMFGNDLNTEQAKRFAAGRRDDAKRMEVSENINNILRNNESKTQIGRLQSVLKLGTQTREEVGRDLEGLVDVAKSLRRNVLKEYLAEKDPQAKQRLASRIDRIDQALKGPPTNATGNTVYARASAKDMDSDLNASSLRRVGDKNFDGWGATTGKDSVKLGEGSYGTVLKAPDGSVVKRGEISNEEAALIQRIGKIDLGPRLIAADINGKGYMDTYGYGTASGAKAIDFRRGRIAMSEVPGKPMGEEAKADTKFGKVNSADAYWRAMANLHRQGIAHNDAHTDNIFIDDKGKGRWVDMGLAQASPKAALAEAFGVFRPLKGGDDVTIPGSAKGNGNWQSRRWAGTGAVEADKAFAKGGQTWQEFSQRFPVASRVWNNQAAAVSKLEKMGLDTNEINSIIEHGIRSPMVSYNQSSGFSRITDQQAQEVLNTLYNGI